MAMLKRERAVEIVTASGTLRVTVDPKPAWLPMLAEAIGIAVFGVFLVRGWAPMPVWYRVLLVWGIGSACVAWLYQLSGSEIIESIIDVEVVWLKLLTIFRESMMKASRTPLD